MLPDWAEAHHTIKMTQAKLYEAMTDGRFDDARIMADDIIVAARAIRVWTVEAVSRDSRQVPTGK
jgi:hypothetical protein